MRDIIKATIGADHFFKCATYSIARNGEGLTPCFLISIPEGLYEYWAYIDFKKPNGETFKTPRIDVNEGTLSYNIPLSVLDTEGKLEVQVVFQNADNEIWKTYVKEFAVRYSINATDDIPDKQDFITEAQKTLDEALNIAKDVEKRANNGEFNGADGKDAVTDQTYDPTSENAQSGIAVAEAVGGKVGWNTLINTTLTADNAGISDVLVALPQDFFEYKVVHLKIGVPYSTTMSSNTIKQNIGICDAAAVAYFGYIAYAIPNSSTSRETGMFNFVANLALTEQETKYTVVSTYIASLAADVGANAQGKANITLVTFDKQNFEKRPPHLRFILTNGTYEEGTEIVVEGLK